MFIGCRGTVVAAPTARGVGLPGGVGGDASRMPAAASAGARNGLSVGCCGRLLSPECSPVTSSVRSKSVSPRAVAQAALSATCAVRNSCEAQYVPPLSACGMSGS